MKKQLLGSLMLLAAAGISFAGDAAAFVDLGLSADGKRPKDTRTDNQKKALKALLTLLKLRFPDAEIRGHRDYAAKACPSFDATFEYKDL